MKRLYILSITLLIFSSGFSQAYKPMLKENKTWDIVDLYTDPFQSCYPMTKPEHYYQRLFLEGDTLVNGYHYYKLYERKATAYPLYSECVLPGEPTFPVFYDTLTTFSGTLLREDSVARKIYKKQISHLYSAIFDTSEYLIYDFSVNVGDTMSSYNTLMQGEYGNYFLKKGVIDSIKMVTLDNNDSTRAFYINPLTHYSMTYPTFFILEGVGSVQGFHSPFKDDFETWYNLACVKDEGEFLFSQAFNIYACGTMMSIEDNKKNSLFKIYPNPNNGKDINIKGHNIELIKVYNMQGQLVKKVSANNNSTTINLTEQPKGIYFVKAQFVSGAIVIEKLVIN